jgi:hypothetical protein
MPAATISTLHHTGVDTTSRPVADNTPDIHGALVTHRVRVGIPLVAKSAGAYAIGGLPDGGWIHPP